MQNLYEVIKGSLFFNRFVLDDLVCVEYTCPLEDEHLGVFTKYDYIIHVLSGRKSWKTVHGRWTIEEGETLYVKKGAAILTQYFDDDFCMLGFFLPDDIIRDSLSALRSELQDTPAHMAYSFTAAEVGRSQYMESFFHSMLGYFRSKEQPPESIIRLKIKELLLNLVHHSHNDPIRSYLKYLLEHNRPSLAHIMESNFCFNLKLEEFAQMCHRSLSAFKRDFATYYGVTPGKWLLNKRLDHAAGLLKGTGESISQITFDSGFEDLSHFGKTFRKKYGMSPSDFRNSMA